MKFAIVIPDGCADEPQASLGGKTPLEAARTPAMDALAAAGAVGRAQHVPAHLPAGSAVANMSLLGYDPVTHFTGRAPIEAAAQGIALGPEDWAIRCNLVTIQDQIMEDFTAGHVGTEEASQLLATAQEQLDPSPLEFVTGVSYRNLLLFRSDHERAPFSTDTQTVAPHDLTDQSVAEHYPRGPGSRLLNSLMADSGRWFADHPVNRRRVAADKRPVTHIWLWGLGRTPTLAAFASTYGLEGAMITAVDLLRGLAALIGWKRIDVPGATGYTDTDYRAKGQAAVAALRDNDLVCVHVEAPDEASHEGDTEAKVRALEEIDQHIVAPVRSAIEQLGGGRMLVTPDHPTPLRTKTHSHGAVPFVVWGQGIAPDRHQAYGESAAQSSSLCFDEGWKLMPYFLRTESHP